MTNICIPHLPELRRFSHRRPRPKDGMYEWHIHPAGRDMVLRMPGVVFRHEFGEWGRPMPRRIFAVVENFAFAYDLTSFVPAAPHPQWPSSRHVVSLAGFLIENRKERSWRLEEVACE